MSRALSSLLLLAAVAGCTGKPQAGTAPASSTVLTRQEIAATPVDNAYDAVYRLRPAFLRSRATGSSSSAYATVFVDGMRRGSIEILRSIAANTVDEIRYISALDATTRYGMNIPGGVLQVTMIRR